MQIFINDGVDAPVRPLIAIGDKVRAQQQHFTPGQLSRGATDYGRIGTTGHQAYPGKLGVSQPPSETLGSGAELIRAPSLAILDYGAAKVQTHIGHLRHIQLGQLTNGSKLDEAGVERIEPGGRLQLDNNRGKIKGIDRQVSAEHHR